MENIKSINIFITTEEATNTTTTIVDYLRDKIAYGVPRLLIGL